MPQIMNDKADKTKADKKPTPRPEPMPLVTENDPPNWLLWFATACIIVGVVIVLAVLAGCAPPPPRVHVVAPAWMLTPVPTVDIGIPALHVWDCVTDPETVCTER